MPTTSYLMYELSKAISVALKDRDAVWPNGFFVSPAVLGLETLNEACETKIWGRSIVCDLIFWKKQYTLLFKDLYYTVVKFYGNVLLSPGLFVTQLKNNRNVQKDKALHTSYIKTYITF